MIYDHCVDLQIFIEDPTIFNVYKKILKEVSNNPNLVCRLFTIINCEISIITIVAGLVRLDHYYKDNY